MTYTDLNKIADQNLDRKNLTPNDFISRLPDYHRLDIGTDYNFKIKGLDAQIGLSIFNLFNFKNVKYTQYIFSIETALNANQRTNKAIGTELELLGITPNLRFELKF